MALAQNGRTETRVTLVGASIGQAWHFDKLPERVPLRGYRLDYVGVPSFDKSTALARLLGGTQKPDFVFIKECATYFPGDMDLYRHRVIDWVFQLRKGGIRPVLVTTPPVGEPVGLLARAKFSINRMLGRQTWVDSIAEYNDWLKAYAEKEQIPLFHLEAVLRQQTGERFLRSEYGVGDYVHLNERAYRALDHAFADFLLRLGTRPH